MTATLNSIESKIRTGTSNPTNPNAGDMYYDTTNNRLMRYNGSYWTGLGFALSTSTSITTSTSTSTSTSSSTSITTTSTSQTTSTSTSTSTTTTL
jgi:hypothetical protein